MSCMHQNDASLVEKSKINSDVLMINQCDKTEYEELSFEFHTVRIFSTNERGLTKSRNMAISKSNADICLLADDDEEFLQDYESKIISAYEKLSDADVITFKIANRPPSFSDKVQQLKFPKILKVSSWQISFKRDSLNAKSVRFDELLGAGTGNGAEEELKFLLDCQKAGLKIYYVPEEIASVAQTESTWFDGFDEKFFYNRGATTRYILGFPIASVYAIYYVIKKRDKYKANLSFCSALKSIFRGIFENKITKKSK